MCCSASTADWLMALRSQVMRHVPSGFRPNTADTAHPAVECWIQPWSTSGVRNSASPIAASPGVTSALARRPSRMTLHGELQAPLQRHTELRANHERVLGLDSEAKAAVSPQPSETELFIRRAA